MVSDRSGHSLPELIVAITILAASLAGVAATAVLGSRWTADAVVHQRALNLAESTLDSLAGLPTRPAPGSNPDRGSGLEALWTVESETGGGVAEIRVEVPRAAPDRPAIVLRAVWTPPIPGPLP